MDGLGRLLKSQLSLSRATALLKLIDRDEKRFPGPIHVNQVFCFSSYHNMEI